MCEILVLKHNNKGLSFSKEAIAGALKSNSDGAGYAVFKKIKNGYDLIEIKKFEVTKSYSTSLSKIPDKTYTDYEWVDELGQVELTTDFGETLILTLPKNIANAADKSSVETLMALKDWLDKKKVKYDFEVTTTSSDYPAISTYKWDYEASDKNDAVVNQIFERQTSLNENELMIVHFRLATSGKTHFNTQPIETSSLVVIHNGVFTSLGDNHLSDTSEFAENLTFLYELAHLKKSEEHDFFERFIDITEGWYSAFIYSKKSKQLHYFKDGATFYSFADNTMYSTKEIRFPISSQEVSCFE